MQTEKDLVQTILQDPIWLQALKLEERAALLKKSSIEKLLEEELKIDLGQKRLKKWLEQYSFNTCSYLAERLVFAGIDEKDLAYLVSEPIAAMQVRLDELNKEFPTPTWLTDIASIFEDSKAEEISSLSSYSQTAALGPLSQWGLRRLRKGIAEFSTRYRLGQSLLILNGLA